MVTSGPFSTVDSAGRIKSSPVPYLTGAFAGTGGFKVSPILGYQAGGLNPDGTPNTTSRQFQAGLSVTGKGVNQNATLFVMTSQISNAPHSGFTQGGGFTGVTVRNPAGWFGLASGAVSSGTSTSGPNTVSTVNGTPIASFTLNNATANLNTGTVTNSQSSNFVKPGGTTSYTFNPITTGTPTFSAGSHPSLVLNGGYVGGVMLTANGGTRGAPTNFTKPYVITNLTGQPGDVGIFSPGDSSELLAVFNVKSVGAPEGGMTNSNYIFGSVAADTHAGLNGARGAYVNPSNFAARAATIFDNGANLPISSRNGQTLGETPGGFADQQMVTADSVGANTSTFLTSISTAVGGGPNTVTPCNCQSTKWGFWSAFNGATNSNGQLAFADQGPLLLWVAGVPSTLGALSGAQGMATYTGHAIASIANPNNITSYLAAGAFSNTVNLSQIAVPGANIGKVTITGLDGSNYLGQVKLTAASLTPTAAPTFGGVLNAVGGPPGRTATLAGSFFQGGKISPAFGEMGGSLILNGTVTNPYLGSGIFAAARTK